MVSLAGASAAYPGYQTARQADNQIQAGDIANQNAQIDQLGTEALGRTIQAFQASIPGAQPMGGPQPPMPGQPSVPRAQEQGPMQGGGYTPQPGQASVATPPQMQSPGFQQGSVSAPPQMQAPGFQAPGGQPQAMQGLPGAQGGIEALRGKLDVKTLMEAIAKANPGAKPAVLAAAVTKALPLLNAQAQMDWKQMSLAMAGGRLENARDGTAIRADEADRKREQGNTRLEQGQTRLDQTGGEYASRDQRRQDQTRQGDVKNELADTREARLAVASQVRQDQGWQKLEQQKAALEQRITQAGDRKAIGEWRAIVDAQHKRAMEIIQSNSINSGFTPADKKALIQEQNQFYENQIKQMRGGQGSTTPTNNQPPAAPGGGKVENRMPQGGAVPGSAPAAAPSRPQAKNPKTGETLEFDGQAWVPVAAAQ